MTQTSKLRIKTNKLIGITLLIFWFTPALSESTAPLPGQEENLYTSHEEMEEIIRNSPRIKLMSSKLFETNHELRIHEKPTVSNERKAFYGDLHVHTGRIFLSIIPSANICFPVASTPKTLTIAVPQIRKRQSLPSGAGSYSPI